MSSKFLVGKEISFLENQAFSSIGIMIEKWKGIEFRSLNLPCEKENTLFDSLFLRGYQCLSFNTTKQKTFVVSSNPRNCQNAPSFFKQNNIRYH